MKANMHVLSALLSVALGCTDTASPPVEASAETPRVVEFPVEEATPEEPSETETGPRTIANAPSPCAEEPSLGEMPLPASMRVSRDVASLALVQIDATGAINVTPAEDAEDADLAELEALAQQAGSMGMVEYRYVRRPDRGGGGGENCLASTTVQSPRFAAAVALYLRSYDFRWVWDPA